MLYAIILLSLVCSVLLMSMSAPPWMLCALILQTLSVGAYLSYTKSSMWMAYILLLVFLGGMLVVLSYLSSLASEDMLEEAPYASLLIFQFLTLSWITMKWVLGTKLTIQSELMESGAFKSGMFDLFSTGSYMMYLLATGCFLLYFVLQM